jgi:hypothetical protein
MTMPKFDPKFAIKPLNEVSPGALVIFDRKPAFASINRSAQQSAMHHVPVTLAVHDVQSGTFVYHFFDGAQPNVLVPTGEIIIRRNPFSHSENVAIHPPSAKLFQTADETYIVVHIPTLPVGDARLLSLSTGSLVRPTVTSADAFDSWEIGTVSLGEFVPLLKV